MAVTGLQQVWGEYYYFRDAAGLPIRVQGEIVDYKGHKLYFDPNNGQMWRNRNANIDGKIIILMKTATLQRFKSSINCN
ncbi:MAG: hypothetical protein ACLS3V_04570 [Streptococcus sp.]